MEDRPAARLDRLIDALVAVGLDPTRDEIADTLWLAVRMGEMGQAREPSDIPPHSSLGEAVSEQPGPEPPLPPATPPGAKQEPEGEVPLYAYRRPEGVSGGQDQAYLEGAAREVRVPGVPALPDALALSRALRPLRRRVPSRVARVLDESATVERIADERLWVPVYRPRPERWLELALVVDAHSSMRIWEPAIVELRRLLERHGAFADVRLWHLQADDRLRPPGKPADAAPRVGLADERGRIFRDPRELRHAADRRVVWIVSDCVAAYWHHSDRLLDLLECWAKRNPLALIQVLPRRLWSMSGLGAAPTIRLRAVATAQPNAWLKTAARCPPGTLLLPVINLDPASLKSWADLIVARPEAAVLGVGLDVRYEPPSNDGRPAAPEAVLAAFRAHFSPQAQRLAELFSTIPLTLPIMRLAQETLLSGSRLTHLAEVFLSGLLGRADRELGEAARETDPLKIPFDFLPGLREALLNGLPLSEIERYASRMAAAVESRLGQASEFLALMADPTGRAGRGLTDKAIPFARMRLKVLRRLGGSYAPWATALDSGIAAWERGHGGPSGLPPAVEAPTEPEPIPGLHDPMKDGTQGPAMVWLPGGIFTMGEDDGRWDDGKPAHQVRLVAFSIGQYPVTFAEYDRFCDATRREKPNDYGWGRERRPAIGLSWWDATSYCVWLGKQTGENYRLATEAEWEYACRAGSTTRYAFGDDEKDLGDYAWYRENAGGRAHPVGEKRPNPWGLYDMHGNVWEWCRDWYSSDYYKQLASDVGSAVRTGDPNAGTAPDFDPPASEDPSGPESGSTRVIRGGSWVNVADNCRSAFRSGLGPSFRSVDLGFRLSRTGPWRAHPVTLGGAEPPAKPPPPQPAGPAPRGPGEAGSAPEPFQLFRDRFVIVRRDGREEPLDAPEMIALPGGSFLMGDERGYDSERPAHRVRLPAFAIGRTPVTWGDYRRFCEATDKHWPEWLERGSQYHIESGKNDYYAQRGVGREVLDLPVVGVAWADALAYCDWLRECTGKPYRLPTEAEWEYACRAGTQTPWNFGDDEKDLGDYAWYTANAEGRLHPVGRKRPNPWGIYDMHGNVWEWVQDWYAGNYYEQLASATRSTANRLKRAASNSKQRARAFEPAVSDGERSASENPSGPESGSYRVVRGGSWFYGAVICRSAYRYGYEPSLRLNSLGFRLSRTL